ncbi:hypothetical protein CDL12_27321 [Handroanthus impetiginosus]|uniref:Uncharacterized protein n=1 Tax=Handroanthus impetiginosus TaxID=429701 RepID=A0A2G9G4D1_9LAMI|nr:hypothetical protein CDL12_27321 [Handroanthus impetiginosus]
MDLETENRIAAILLKEAAELRRQAQSEGALAYLRQPTVRSRPNSRFLTATVRGVQQANRAVEVNEMWRIREKQLELDDRRKWARNSSCGESGYNDVYEPRRSRSTGHNETETSEPASHSTKKRFIEDFDPKEDEGLRDDEVDEFLQSRTKRGRGSIGSRMDETGPFLPSCQDSKSNVESSDEEEPKKPRVLLGPEKPYSLNSSESSDDESHKDRRKKKKKKTKIDSSKQHSKKHKSKEKSKDKKKKRREDKKRKHHK